LEVVGSAYLTHNAIMILPNKRKALHFTGTKFLL